MLGEREHMYKLKTFAPIFLLDPALRFVAGMHLSCPWLAAAPRRTHDCERLTVYMVVYLYLYAS